VLQEREVLRIGANEPVPVDIRVIAASNREPLAQIGQGLFRADLFFRLNVLRLHVPPLRERQDDIASIARHWLNRTARHAIPDDWIDRHIDALTAYRWPGNVRELENVMERVLACTGAASNQANRSMISALVDLRVIAPELFEALATPRGSSNLESAKMHPNPLRRARITEASIVEAMKASDGRVEEAARWLGVSRVTLWRRLRARKQIGA
jgi:propionate catabolism operon transcriptional regulator